MQDSKSTSGQPTAKSQPTINERKENMARSDTKNNYVPKDYDDLYRYYIRGDGQGNSLCHQLIRSMMPHATEDEKEILAQDVATRLIDKDMLKKFDPKEANFGGVIYFVTRTVVCNHLDRKGRNPLTGLAAGRLSENDPEDGEFEPGTYSLDRLFGTQAPRHDEGIDASHMVSRLLLWARKLKWDVPEGRENETAFKRMASLHPLIFLLAEGNDAKECGAKLGVSPSTIVNWISVIRDKATELQAELDA